MNDPLSLIPPSERKALQKAAVRDITTKAAPLSVGFIVVLMFGVYKLANQDTEKLEAIDRNLEKMTLIIGQLEKQLGDLKSDMKDLRRDTSVIEGRTSGIRGDMDAINTKLDSK